MWRIGVVLVLATLFADSTSNNLDQNSPLERLKRSPQYGPPNCPPPPPPPPFWPPPPPPPFWPPPPPPRPPPPPPPHWYQYQQPNQGYTAESQANAGAQANSGGQANAGAQANSGAQAYSSGQANSGAEANAGAQSEALRQSEQAHIEAANDQEQAGQPCDSCSPKQNTAVSNADSDLGTAIAVAIARAKVNNQLK